MHNKSLILASFLVGISVLASAYLISNSSLSVRTTQTGVTEDGSLTNAISVSGDGTAVRDPDLAVVTVTVSERNMSSTLAQQTANEKIEQVANIASTNGVSDDKIKTIRLSINPRYEWQLDQQVFRGYDAVQTLEIESAYSEGNESFARILDGVAGVSDVQIDSIKFDYEDKKSLANEARELAYKSAEEKASQLAGLSGVTLGKPISIIDQSSQFNTSASQPNDMMLRSFAIESDSPSTQVFAGELEHRVVITVLYGIE